MSVQVKEKLAACFVWGAALLTVGALVIIIGYIMFQGLDRISISFLLENPRRMGSEGVFLSTAGNYLFYTGYYAAGNSHRGGSCHISH